MLTVASVTVFGAATKVALHLYVVSTLSDMVYSSVIELIPSYVPSPELTRLSPNKRKWITEHTCSTLTNKKLLE